MFQLDFIIREKLKEGHTIHQMEDSDNILKQRAYRSLTFLPTLSLHRNTSAPLDPFAGKASKVDDKVEYLNPSTGSSRRKKRSASLKSGM